MWVGGGGVGYHLICFILKHTLPHGQLNVLTSAPKTPTSLCPHQLDVSQSYFNLTSNFKFWHHFFLSLEESYFYERPTNKDIGGSGDRGIGKARGGGGGGGSERAPSVQFCRCQAVFKDKIAVKNSLASIYYFSHSTLVGSAKVQDSTVFEYTCLVTCDLLWVTWASLRPEGFLATRFSSLLKLIVKLWGLCTITILHYRPQMFMNK